MALQQLSDASDSLERYKSLKKIGVTEKLINSAILRQCLIYFLVPLGLVTIHYESIIVTSLVLVIIYSSYF